MNLPTDHDQWQRITATLDEIKERLERIEEKLTQPSSEEGPEWLSIKAAAQMTGLSQSHIRRAVKSGRLAASNVGSEFHPIWRISRADLRVWMLEQRIENRIPPRAELQELVRKHLPDL